VGIAFIEYCIENKIMLAILPPHLTHRLQPLDVSLFSPLAKYYDKHLGIFNQKNQGWTRFTKRNFFANFWKAWEDAITSKNVKSGWAKIGLYPFDASVVIKQLEKEEKEEVPNVVESPSRLRTTWQQSWSTIHRGMTVTSSVMCSNLRQRKPSSRTNSKTCRQPSRKRSISTSINNPSLHCLHSQNMGKGASIALGRWTKLGPLFRSEKMTRQG
jgi:hypothetical protein